jgi:hypothetical protein
MNARTYWTELKFSKYRGKTLPQIMLLDPDWFFWALDCDIFEDMGALLSESEDIDSKARNIKIRNNNSGEYVAEYFRHTDGTYSDFCIVPEGQPAHPGSTLIARLQVIDMSVPYRLKKYDKRGNSNFIRTMKSHIFGDKSKRMTKTRCEEFFSYPGNFALQQHAPNRFDSRSSQHPHEHGI